MKNNSEKSPLLCDRCQYAGKCLEYHRTPTPKLKSEYDLDNKILPLNTRDFTSDSKYRSLSALINQLPIRVEGTRFSRFTKLHLDKGFEAFHQKDYETALINLLAAFDGISQVKEVLLCISLCHFFLGDYDNAVVVANVYNSRYSYYFSSDNLDYLIDLCAVRQEDMKRKEILEEQKEIDNEVGEKTELVHEDGYEELCSLH